MFAGDAGGEVVGIGAAHAKTVVVNNRFMASAWASFSYTDYLTACSALVGRRHSKLGRVSLA